MKASLVAAMEASLIPLMYKEFKAYPGRLNQVFVFINREGVFYGQCSEI